MKKVMYTLLILVFAMMISGVALADTAPTSCPKLEDVKSKWSAIDDAEPDDGYLTKDYYIAFSEGSVIIDGKKWYLGAYPIKVHGHDKVEQAIHKGQILGQKISKLANTYPFEINFYYRCGYFSNDGVIVAYYGIRGIDVADFFAELPPVTG